MGCDWPKKDREGKDEGNMQKKREQKSQNDVICKYEISLNAICISFPISGDGEGIEGRRFPPVRKRESRLLECI